MIAEVVDLPGVMVYGATMAEAFGAAKALALRVLADRMDTEGSRPPASPGETLR